MAEIGPKEQSEKAESCRENLWNETHKNRTKRRGQAGLV